MQKSAGKHDVMLKLQGQLTTEIMQIGIPDPIVKAHYNYFNEFDTKTTLEHARDYNALKDSCRASGWISNERQPSRS